MIQTVKCNCISVVTAIGGQGSGVGAAGGGGKVYCFKTFFPESSVAAEVYSHRGSVFGVILVQDGDLKGIWKPSRTNF